MKYFFLTFFFSSVNDSFANGDKVRSNGGCDGLIAEVEEDITKLLDRYDDDDIISGACENMGRDVLIAEETAWKNSNDPCEKELYQRSVNASPGASSSLSSKASCQSELKKELVKARAQLDKNQQYTTFEKEQNIGDMVNRGVQLVTDVVQVFKKDVSLEREGITEIIDVTKERFQLPAEMNNCKTTEYDVSLIITPGPHATLGAKPVDTSHDNCPTLLFESSNYNRERKSIHLVEGTEWGDLKKDPMFYLGNTELRNLFDAFEVVDVLQQNQFHVESNNCFHFTQSMWRHLGVPESDDLLNFIVEEVVKDKNTFHILSGKGSTDRSRNLPDKEMLRKYIYEIASQQIA